MLSQTHDLQLNGLVTLGENIADHVGIKIGYDAFKAWQRDHPAEDKVLPGLGLTTDQTFFVGYAQVSIQRTA